MCSNLVRIFLKVFIFLKQTMTRRQYYFYRYASEYKNINKTTNKALLDILPVQTNIGGTEAQTNINLQKNKQAIVKKKVLIFFLKL